MIDLEKILELEAKATSGPWFADVKGCCEGDGPHGVVWFELEDLGRTAIFEGSYWSNENEILTAYMRNNIKSICLELKAAREYFAKDIEVRQISLKDGLQAASNAWQDREDLRQKYHEVANGK